MNNSGKKYLWFRKWGWIYQPTSIVGWVLTVLTCFCILWVTMITNLKMHSIDLILAIIPWVYILISTLGWIASHTSE